MIIKEVIIENFKGISNMHLSLDRRLNVFIGDNASGKTSVLGAIVAGLGPIVTILSGSGGVDIKNSDMSFNNIFNTRVALETWDGLRWDRHRRISFTDTKSETWGMKALHEDLTEKKTQLLTEDQATNVELPIIAYYGTDRAVFGLPQRRRGFKAKFSRTEALKDALTAKTTFRHFFEWFHSQENIELREARQKGTISFKLPSLETVRSAISRMIPGASNPRIEINPLRFVVDVKFDTKKSLEKLTLDNLSGGYRIVLAMVADLALRMAEGNSHLEDPLKSEAIVLIDEVDLHLHPKWQQEIVPNLLKTFPKAQFFITTHSPQVLSSLDQGHIYSLRQSDNGVLAELQQPTYGAESGRLLTEMMGLKSQRVPQIQDQLNKYYRMIQEGKFDSDEAKRLRDILVHQIPDDPDLATAEMMIKRYKAAADEHKK